MDRPALLDFPQQIAGRRVVLRQFRDDDAAEVHAAIQESIDHIRPWLPWYDKHATAADTLEFIRRTRAEILLNESFGLGIFSAENGDFLGGTGLGVRNWRIPAFEIGYWIRASQEGHGYITEATKLLTGVAFDVLAAQRLMIRCDSRNQRSRAVPERLGFVREGELRRDNIDTDGKPHDTLIYSMLPEEYDRLKETW